MTDSPELAAPAGEAPLTPGSRLQQARVKRGMSVLEAGESLHLDPWVVEALEANRFSQVGPPVYAKGHLKQYAVLLGVPADQIMTAYEQLQTQGEADAMALAPKNPAGRISETSVVIAVAAIAVLLVVGILLWWHPWHRRASPVSAAAQAHAPAKQPDAMGTPPSAIIAAPPAPSMGAVVGSSKAAPTGFPGAGHLRLRLSFTAKSWVEVRDVTGAFLFRGRGAANSTKVVSGAAPLYVYLGLVSGVQMEVNGHTIAIAPEFVHGNVARFDAGADGVLRQSNAR